MFGNVLNTPLTLRTKADNLGNTARRLTCSYTNNFLSPIPVFDRLIFCCGNLIIHQKK